jgi:hypothetical protein
MKTTEQVTPTNQKRLLKEMSQLKKENTDLKYRLRTGFVCSCGRWVKMSIEEMRKHGITPYYGDKP